MIDADPVRPSGISSTDEEKAKALEVIRNVHAYLKDAGWPAPISADSGNGFHLLYRLDLPNTPEVTAAIKAALAHVAGLFDTQEVKVDKTVYNAARIVKIYGTKSCKGADTLDRPHRQSCLRMTDGGKTAVTLEQLKSLAPTTATKKKSSLIVSAPAHEKTLGEISADKIEDFLAYYGVSRHEPETLPDGSLKWVLTSCPFNADHANKDAAVFLKEGRAGFKCFHNSCADFHWKEFREHMEETTGKKFFFFTNAPTATASNIDTDSACVMEKASDVAPEKIEWLWKNRIPFGKLTLFVGHPGLGKGLATMDVVARATTGRAWPDANNTTPPIEVIVVSSEDAAGDTVVPRLIAADADRTKVNLLKFTKTPTGEKEFSLDTDLPALRKALESNPGVKLVVIDPLMNHLGTLRGNAEQELRNALTPLGRLAEQFGVAVIIVTHFNKNVAADSVQRVGGAMAVVGAVRIAWAFVLSKDDGTRAMLPLKMNIAKDTGGLKYDIVSATVPISGSLESVGRIDWEGVTFEDLGSVMKSDAHNSPPTKIAQAKEWLTGILKPDDPKIAGEIIALAGVKGIAENTLRRAYKELGGLKPQKHGGGWFWQFSAKEAQ